MKFWICLLVLFVTEGWTQDNHENDLRATLASTQKLVEEILTKLKDSERQNEYVLQRLQLSEKTNMELEQRLEASENGIRQLQNCSRTGSKRLLNYAPTDVAFSTRLSKQLSGLAVHQSIAFDKVLTDTASAYNTQNGAFTAPLTGMYVFTWTIGVEQYESTELVVDGNIFGYSVADTANDGDPDYGSASQTVVIQVNKHQRVWIRTTRGSGAIDGHGDETFSGWLLYSLE